MTPETPQTPLRVLVVDDEPLVCWSLAQTLVECGDIVTEARTGAAAIRAMTDALEPADVVLLDYYLPDSRNLALLATLKRLSPSSRVILMSANFQPETAGDAMAMGAYCVIHKPIDMHDVPALVHGAVRSSARH